MADLDLTEFLKEGSGGAVSDLDWLAVNEKDYREMDRLPKQNLDIAPDLQALWSHEDKPSTAYVPNTGGPRTMGDLSQVHGPLRSSPEDLVRAARLAMMQTTNQSRVRSVLAARFDRDSIRAASTALSGVMAECGLLGQVYIVASDFPDCNKGSRTSPEFVRRYAGDAKFVLAKEECQDCQCRQVAAGGASHCSVFHKQVVVDVPYSDALAENVERMQAAKGKVASLSVASSPKERIQRAILAGQVVQATEFSGHMQVVPQVVPVDTQQALITAADLTKKRDAAIQEKLAVEKARPIVATLRREMLKGRSSEELLQSIRLAFDLRDLQATRAHWEPVFKQAGLYGTVYMTQDSFEDCREGADFLSRHSSKVRAVIAGQKCASCIFAQANRCLMYGRKLVQAAEEVLTADTVRAVIDEHQIAGNLPHTASKHSWGDTPVEALKAIHKAASGPKPTTGSLREIIEKGFYGTPHMVTTGQITKREIVRVASEYLNEGLYGDDLRMALQARFDPRDLIASADDLRPVLAEQGLQGIKYVDPTIYSDYGSGCHTAARLHRSRGAVKYAKVGNKCASCVFQTQPGMCSVLNKQLVIEPPYIDKLAEQQAVLSSGRSTEVSLESLVNSGLTMMQEYNLQHQAATDLELNPEAKAASVEIEFGSQNVKL
jgi:hypothetical protein